MKKKLTRSLSAMVAAVIVLGACTPAAPQQAAQTSGGDTQQAATGGDAPAAGGGQNELMIVAPSMIVTMDPVMQNDSPSAQVRSQVFDTLIVFNPRTLEFDPGLAVSWENPDPYTVHLELRQGVTFHNGDPFTAADVQFTFERAIESPHTSTMFEMIDYVEIHDDHNITIHLNEAFVPILGRLAQNQAGIVHSGIARDLGLDNFHENPIGTGPFAFDNIILGDRTMLVRNDNWWGPTPAFERMTFRVVPEGSNRLIEVETGAADIGMALQASDIPRAEETDSVTLHRNMNFSYNYIGFNLFNPDSPTYDVRVRQAIAYALDLDAIVQHAFHGAGAPAQGPLTTSHQFFVPTEPFPFDLDRARELMAEAGYPDGFSVNFWVNEGNQMRFDAAVIVQNQLRQIDIDVNVEVLEWSSYLERTANAEHDMFILGWISGNPDPDTGLWMVFHGINSGLPGNRSFFDHPEANELLERGRGEVDDAVRAEIYARIQHIIRDEAPHIFMWEGEELIVSTPAVQNFFANPTGSPWFWEVYFAE